MQTKTGKKNISAPWRAPSVRPRKLLSESRTAKKEKYIMKRKLFLKTQGYLNGVHNSLCHVWSHLYIRHRNNFQDDLTTKAY